MSPLLSRRQLLSLGTVPLLGAPAIVRAQGSARVIRIGSPESGVGDRGFPGANPLTVARQRGWIDEAFARDGVKVEWHFFRGAGPAVNEAVSAGQLDVVYLGDLAGVIGRARGLPTRLIAPSGRNTHSYLATAPGSTIRSVADLKGRKVAVLKGTAYQRPFGRLLADARLSERDVRVINMDWPTSKAAVVSGDIDATFGGADLQLLADKGVGLPLSTKGRGPSYTIQSGLIATQAFIDQQPALAARLVEQLVRGAQWASEESHRAELLGLYAEASGQPPLLWRKEFEGESLKVRSSPRFDEGYRSGYRGVVADALKLGLIRNPVDVDAWIEPRFVEQALRQARLEAHWPLYDAFGNAGKASA